MDKLIQFIVKLNKTTTTAKSIVVSKDKLYFISIPPLYSVYFWSAIINGGEKWLMIYLFVLKIRIKII